jgi:hypothetical protein
MEVVGNIVIVVGKVLVVGFSIDVLDAESSKSLAISSGRMVSNDSDELTSGTIPFKKSILK